MNRYCTIGFLALAVLCMSCKKDEEDHTHVRDLWSTGSYPVPSPVDQRVLFMQEQSPAGLYVLNGDHADQVPLGALGVRNDYVWTRDGSRIAFSVPGESGGEHIGIWISANGNPLNVYRIWDRGSHPSFYPVETRLVCGGPEDGSADEGIWQLDFTGSERARLADHGVAPEVSPDGLLVAFLLTTGGSEGRTLVILHRDSHVQDTIAVNVLRHSWLGDSQTIVYEKVQSLTPPQSWINLVRPGDPLSGVPVAPGTAPAGYLSSNEFVYAGISGDMLSGIYLASSAQTPRRISTIGTNPKHAGGDRVVAQDGDHLIEIIY